MKKLMMLMTCMSLTASYQDVVVNNEIVNTGEYPCQKRYEVFKPLLANFKRPFTILDIGAAQGFFSLKSAYEYPQAIVTMIEGGYSWDQKTSNVDPEKLLDICKKNNNLENIIFLRKQITIEDLQALSTCEHFDIVFALNILHHFGSRWKEAVDTVLSLADFIIIELPSYASEELLDYVAKKAPHVLATFNRFGPNNAIGTMRLYENKKDRITAKSFGQLNQNTDKTYKIISDFNHKYLVKYKSGKLIEKRPWKAGINFCTFKSLNGVWPTKELFASKLKTVLRQTFSVAPHDMIIQGSYIEVLKSSNAVKLNHQNFIKNILNNIK